VQLSKEFSLTEEEIYSGFHAITVGSIKTLFESGLSSQDIVDSVKVMPPKERIGGSKCLLNQI